MRMIRDGVVGIIGVERDPGGGTGLPKSRPRRPVRLSLPGALRGADFP